ncbi:MAG: UDP-N-acetylglucosamine--N-acetylmuramyl-(pentapeptide) pyrophosphoryl-undecaprenol N-acetylglucosamine transferase [Acidobacteriota bacterium]
MPDAMATTPTASPAPTPTVWITGGGSGGHVFPGLAVAEELARRGVAVAWAGGAGMEGDLVRSRGLDFHQLAARPVVGQGRLGRLRAVATLARSAWHARRLLRAGGVGAVLGTGGYASAPAVVGSWLARRPVLLLEPNSEAGVANRMLSRFAAEALLADAATGAALRCPSTVTGVPVRAAFDSVDAPPEPPPLRLLVLGGSQGAQQLNRLLPAALARLSDARPLGRLEIVHQTGAAHRDATRRAYADALPGSHDQSSSATNPLDPETSGAVPHDAATPATETIVQVDVVPFLDDVARAMEQSHVVVSRAGAITLAEICAAGRPALLVPLRLAGGHQARNARRLQRAGAACMLGDTVADGADGDEAGALERAIDDAAQVLGELLSDAALRARMAAAARSLARPSAAADIAERVVHHLENHRRAA